MDMPEKPNLPVVVEEYLNNVTRRIRNRCAREDVRRELESHFREALAEADEAEREAMVRKLIEEFGSPEMLGLLIKRAKKRCRPAWVKFTIRSLQAVGVLILLVVFYSLWAYFDTPSPMVDYVAKANAMVRPTADESQNAAVDYVAAGKLFVKPPKEVDDVVGAIGATLTTSEQPPMREWLVKNEPAFAKLIAGSRKPQCWYRYEGKDMFRILLPYVAAQRQLGRGLCWRTVVLDAGDQDRILTDLQTNYRQARHLQANSLTIIEKLVGMAIQQMVSCNTLFLLKSQQIAPSSLAKLAAMFDELYPDGYPEVDLKGEEMMGLDTIQHVFTNGGFGGGHICPRELRAYINDVQGTNESLLDLWKTRPETALVFVTHPRRDATEAAWHEWFQILEQRKVPPYEWNERQLPGYRDMMKKHSNNLFLSVFLPGLERTIVMNYRTRAGFDATRTVVAALRYRQDNKRLPDTLRDLVPAYLKEPPRDPYGPGPLVYKRQGDAFTLYSLASNKQDDGGVRGKEDQGWGKPDEAVDFVFWPPQPMSRKTPK